MNAPRLFWVMTSAAISFLIFPVAAAEFTTGTVPERRQDEPATPVVTLFMHKWREPGATALSTLPPASFTAAPTPWRHARWPDSGLIKDGGALLQGRAPREFGVRVRLSETDTAFVKVLSFRGNGPKSRALGAIPHLPQTMLDRPGTKAFAAGVKLRF